MRHVGFFLLGLSLLIVQTTAFRVLGLSEQRLQLWLTLVVFYGFRMAPVASLIHSFLLGYASDVFSGGTHGIGALSALLVVLALQWTKRGLILKSPVALGLLAGPASILWGISCLGLGLLIGGSSWVEDFGLWPMFFQALWLEVISPPLMYLFQLIESLGRVTRETTSRGL
jgi:branched-subunit amino acid transport protein AzlD